MAPGYLFIPLSVFFPVSASVGPSEDPGMNFLKNVGESVAAALSPLGKWLSGMRVLQSLLGCPAESVL